jgi:hypothetical protein
MIAIATLSVGVLSVLVGGGQVFAAPTPGTNEQNTLKLSPVRSDISIAPGKSSVVSVKVANLTKSPMTIQSIQNDFVAGDERGTPALILDADEFAPTHSLKRFMAPIKNVTIAPNTTQEIKLTINVPADAKAGGYYGAVRFAPVTGSGSQNVNLNASAASLVLLTVPGDTVEQLNLTKFDIRQGAEVDSIFQSANDLQLTFRFENKGNVQQGPFGQITIKQGDTVIDTYDFNTTDPRDQVLPDSARIWDVPLKNIGSFGNYTVTALFTYGKDNKTLEVTKSFWVIPISVILITVGGLILLILIIVAVWIFLRDYKKRILKKHGKGRR